jgi:hypothetical protein
MGPRYVTLAPFDEAGKPAGAPTVVTPKDGHVMGFDLAGARDGGALVAWRDDRASPGTAGGTVRLALVRSGGSIDWHVVADDDVGAGAPSLVVDAPPSAQHGWLTLANEADALRVVALDGDGPRSTIAVNRASGWRRCFPREAGKFRVTPQAASSSKCCVRERPEAGRPP